MVLCWLESLCEKVPQPCAVRLMREGIRAWLTLAAYGSLLVEIKTKPLTQACLTPDCGFCTGKLSKLKGRRQKGPGCLEGSSRVAARSVRKSPQVWWGWTIASTRGSSESRRQSGPIRWAPRGLETAGTGRVHQSSRFHGEMEPGYPTLARDTVAAGLPGLSPDQAVGLPKPPGIKK